MQGEPMPMLTQWESGNSAEAHRFSKVSQDVA